MLRFSVLPGLKLSLGGGMGYNSPFASTGAVYEAKKLGVAASFSSMGKSFQRIGGVTTNAPEHTGANINLRYQPYKRLGLNLAHERLFSPVLTTGTVPQKTSLDSAGAYTNMKGFRFNVSMTRSTSGLLKTKTQNLTVWRDITRSVSASGSVLKMQSNTGTSNVYIGTVRESISPRLVFNEGVSRQGNMNTFTFGGHFVSNRITLGFQHDLLYTPLAGGFGGKPYTHVWSFSVNGALFRGIRIHTDSITDPAGKTRYTAWADGIGHATGDEPQGPNPAANLSLGKFVVKGIVLDTEGKPVWGISVQVDGQSAYSDSAGRFFVRFSHGLQYPVAVIPERSLNPQAYRVVQVPVSVLAQPEDEASPMIIIVAPVRQSGAKKKRPDFAPPPPEATGPFSDDDLAPRPYYP